MNKFKPTTGLRAEGLSNSLWSEDLAVVPTDERTFGISHVVSLSVATSLCLPAYMLASGLVAIGMSCGQALGTLLFGNLIALIAIVVNGYAGAKYGISFTVCLRAAFGVRGASVPAILQALVACGWFGIQSWIGGQVLFAIVRTVSPAVGPSAVWVCFAAFWLLNAGLVLRGQVPGAMLRIVGGGLFAIVILALFFSTVPRAGAFGELLAVHTGQTTPEFSRIFLPSLTAVVGFWSAAILSVTNTTRYARSQRVQALGHVVGLAGAMTACAAVAVIVTAASVVLSPQHTAIWNPIELVARLPQPTIAIAGLLLLLLATLNANLGQDILSVGRVFANLRPNLLSGRMGSMIAAVLGIAWMPWALMASPERYLGGWLLGVSGLMGPVAGIMMADFFIVRRRWINVDALYVQDGAGFNLKAVVSLAIGVALAEAGILATPLHGLHEVAWFVGFALAAVLYVALMSGPDVQAMIPPNPLLIPVDGFKAESPMA